MATGGSLKFAASAEPRKDSILQAIAAAVDDLGIKECWGDSLTFKVNLVLDELTTNILTYGGVEGRLNPDIEIDIASRGDDLIIEISDDGHPFDPLTDPPPASVDYESSDVAVVGGLGIHPREEHGGQHVLSPRGRQEPYHHDCTAGLTPTEGTAPPGESHPRRGHRRAKTGHTQLTNVPMTRAMLCAISLSSGNDSMPITE